jgi:hypothetical protein
MLAVHVKIRSVPRVDHGSLDGDMKTMFMFTEYFAKTHYKDPDDQANRQMQY